MPGAKQLYDRVRENQARLGTGDTDEALEAAEPLRREALRILSRGAMLSSFEKDYATAALAYATVTLILGMAESRLPAEFVPKVRELAAESIPLNRPGSDLYKVPAAAAEILARAGDAEGSVWAIKKAEQMRPGLEELQKVAVGIKSMYPQVYAEMPEPVADTPPEMPAGRK